MITFQNIFTGLEQTKVLEIPGEMYIPIDISNKNKELRSFDISSSASWEKYIAGYLEKHNAEVAYGGYLEVRDIYQRSSCFYKGDETYERNIHLGIDLWTKENTPVLAVLDGVVHSFKNNTNYGDYGPTIILEHSIDRFTFFTLYGHLSVHSIEGLKTGQQVKKGDTIGFLGTAPNNGDYAPHLHFQIILDIQNYTGDYPGVCAKNELVFYKKNCPDPNFLLKLEE